MRDRLSLPAITAVMVLFVGLTLRWPVQGGTRSIRSDVKGYHGYLRALFITHDLGREKADAEYLSLTPTGTLNKYFAGESVMLLPFFLGAHGLAPVLGYPADGHSLPYQRCIHLAALVYALLGLLCFRALLLGLRVRDGTVAILILSLGFGTQLLQYTAIQPGWTHVYSFCAISAFLLSVLRLDMGTSDRWLVAAGALFGLIVLIRPVNGLVLLAVPVVIGDRTKALLGHAWSRPLALTVAVLACFAVLAIQPLLWHAQTGRWLEWSYRNEGFYWNDPKMMKVLFSVRCGLFVWTPLLIAAALSAVALWKVDRVRSVAAITYWAINTYVISAWWIWYYGSGFGLRVFIDHYPVLLLPLALLLDRMGRRWRAATVSFMAVATVFHFIQFYQYNHYVIDGIGMDRAKYAYTFLKFGETYREVLGGNDQEAPYHPNGMTLVKEEQCDMEGSCRLWTGGKVEERPGEALSGTRVCVLDSSTEFSLTFRMPSSQLSTRWGTFFEIELHRFSPHPRASFDALAIFTAEGPAGSMGYYEPRRMNPLPDDRAGEWERIQYRIPLTDALLPDQEVRFYIWNKEHGDFLLDDFSVRAWVVNPF